MSIFRPFDVLIPKKEYLPLWPVIACDQFTSQKAYWDGVRAAVGSAPSALNCILPEAELKEAGDDRFAAIRRAMTDYLAGDVFDRFPASFVYVERTLSDGGVRPGVVGVIDLETYDYREKTTAAIRATEKTVVERIPPRMRVRRGAKLELSHVLLLCDDERKEIIEPLKDAAGEILYDLDLVGGGGHITGKRIAGAEAEALLARLDAYEARKKNELSGMLYAVGDGNHSLATAKECYEELKRSGADPAAIVRARFAMVELENIHDPSQKFEPIHRLITGVDAARFLACLENAAGAPEGYPVPWVAGDREGVLYLDRNKGVLPVGILQTVLDGLLAREPGEIDYIHGAEDLKELARRKDSLGFLLPAIGKGDFFRGIAADGVLPRKTFSMGEAREKRYYLEGREL